MNTVTLPFHNKTLSVETAEIIRLEASGNYTLFYLLDGRQVLTCKSLHFYDELLPFPFVRVHKSCLININYVTERKTPTLLSLTDGSEIHIARRRKATITQYMSYKRKPRSSS
ncbi:LytR/AlgR family response regulator transcription factor [Runella sp.]|jgi:DNA-binding LytR/AlgR family response regulator|uniref:LytR/AlgR family response regulator transcription factor n=1 Tax=Runella sp. TaxID=1960881 RepID=UPI0038F654A8